MEVQTLHVGFDDRSYPIHIGASLLGSAGQWMRNYVSGSKVFIVSNPTVAQHHLPTLQAGLTRVGITTEVWLVPDGENYKNWEELEKILTWLLEKGAERQSPLVALGGGVIGDLAGLAAALYQRGMPLIQVPTTLLSQVDSSVGGKTAVNHPLGKNMIGAFYQPRQVLIDLDTLATLPPREYRSGLAEVVKYGAIRDKAFFEWLEQHAAALRERDLGTLQKAVYESCKAKTSVVVADEQERGERALLNFGHTFGHAIETALGYGQWLHGEAVAVGMVMAGKLSLLCCGLGQAEQHRLGTLLQALELPIRPPAIPAERWRELMGRDKKVEAGKVRFILLERLGHAVVSSDVAGDALMQVLRDAG